MSLWLFEENGYNALANSAEEVKDESLALH